LRAQGRLSSAGVQPTLGKRGLAAFGLSFAFSMQ